MLIHTHLFRGQEHACKIPNCLNKRRNGRCPRRKIQFGSVHAGRNTDFNDCLDFFAIKRDPSYVPQGM